MATPYQNGHDDAAIRAVIWQHIGAISTCMMVTAEADAMLARPMRGIADPDANAIWFFSDRDTEKAEQAGASSSCCLAFSDTHAQKFVSASGRLELIDDRAEIKRRWTEGASVYFPRGGEDNQVVLLRFTPERASYWDAPSNPVVLAIKFLQAKVTGNRPTLGSNESADMR